MWWEARTSLPASAYKPSMVCRCPISLERSGYACLLDDIGVFDVQEIPERLMAMVLHTSEARLRSAAWNEHAMAEMLPAQVAPDSALLDEHIKYMGDLWQASVLAGSEQDTGFGSQAVRKHFYWLDWPAVQWLMRLLAHFSFSKTAHTGAHRPISLHTHGRHEDDKGGV